jgi:hypothetical protein
MQLSVQILNAEIVRKGLEDLHAEIPKIGRLQIRRTMEAIVKTMKVYPSAPAGSRYVRTYKLRDSWRITQTVTGYKVSADPTNKGRRYGRYVVGFADGDGQAWMHVGRWSLLRDVMEREIDKLPPAVSNEISMVARAKGLT